MFHADNIHYIFNIRIICIHFNITSIFMYITIIVFMLTFGKIKISFVSATDVVLFLQRQF